MKQLRNMRLQKLMAVSSPAGHLHANLNLVYINKERKKERSNKRNNKPFIHVHAQEKKKLKQSSTGANMASTSTTTTHHHISHLTLLIIFLASLLVISSTLLITYTNAASSDDDVDQQQVYIVYMGELPKKVGSIFSTQQLHTSMLHQVLGNGRLDRNHALLSSSIIYSYKRSFNGFAAMLTTHQVKLLEGMEGVVSIFPSGKKKLDTTRSWSYVGLPENAERRNITESEIVVGVIDSGIWPESHSFNDSGFGPPPSKWKGACSSSNFTCNNKVIGARYYRRGTPIPSSDSPSPRDTDGHGTHTASTAAGTTVPDASMESLARGTARGAVPSSRIATYKVCWYDGCYDEDILAAFDDAIADGVDVISLSVGGSGPSVDYFKDSIAIGAFHAMKKGILTSASAGNEGPVAGTVHNLAPWILTVAASTTDTEYVSKVKLGNGESFVGTAAINTVDLGDTMYPVVYGGNAPNITGNNNVSESRKCLRESLNGELVRGRIVLCEGLSSGGGASSAGAVGSIIQNSDPSELTVSYNFPRPTSCLLGANLSKYVLKTSNPTATISKSIETKTGTPPLVPFFSSRGPNSITTDILKPDIVAPGVNILAAWSQATTVTGEEGDRRLVPYNIIYGTSMACPHATGAAAYIKSFHPTWSPAAIRSAVMTTATPMTPANNPEAELAYGAGLINLTKCNDPGLVYDAGELDYIKFLCGQGYTPTQIKLTTGQDDVNCSTVGKSLVWELNYPSFALSAEIGTNVTRVFHRSVTNVGSTGSSNYTAMLTSAKELVIKVEPQVLSFTSVGETKEFDLTVTASLKTSGVVSGVLVWSDGAHQVRSPIVAHTI